MYVCVYVLSFVVYAQEYLNVCLYAHMKNNSPFVYVCERKRERFRVGGGNVYQVERYTSSRQVSMTCFVIGNFLPSPPA